MEDLNKDQLPVAEGLPEIAEAPEPSKNARAAAHHLELSPARFVYTESSRGRVRKIRTFDLPSPPPGSKTNKKRKKTGDDVENEFDKEWICAECKEAECALAQDDDAEKLLLCEGPCRRLFHYPCANLQRLPADDEPFHCLDCSSSRHRCAICQDYGNDGIDVFKCRRENCGYFFHEGCLAIRSIDFTYTNNGKSLDETSEDAMDDNRSLAIDVPVFECPAHYCWTCRHDKNQDNPNTEVLSKGKRKRQTKSKIKSGADDSKRGGLFCCIECPRSYHITCIPPMARLHELAMLCHEHAATCKLPDLETESSIQHALESKIDEKFFTKNKKTFRLPKTQISRNAFFGGSLCGHRYELETRYAEKAVDTIGEDLGSLFCLPVTIKDSVYAMPPTYRHIQANKVNARNGPQRVPYTDSCQCKEQCLDECINRLLYVECSAKNCNVGPLCGNRRLSLRKVPRCQVKREQGKGWGLVILEDAKRNDLIQEYVGEVIDETEKEQRLQQWSKDYPNDQNFYIMANAPGWFIDARINSNLSRFINHSCAPNCILSKFNVNGVTRNGIYALRDIHAGEFLSYDYNFDTLHNEKFTCRCGASTCRGTLRYTAQRKEENTNKSKPQLWEDAKNAYERDKKFLEEYDRDKVTRCSQVAAILPGCVTNDEFVASGPQRQKYRHAVTRKGIFLWRNAELGSNFVSRSIRLMDDDFAHPSS
ncbi:hypothetical protein MPSEU_000434700 [Mayamaea pseudoterrestris]|nr:hypothetical protein MPSEU_000434700 [Mayamaea pseudoterrestris]